MPIRSALATAGLVEHHLNVTWERIMGKKKFEFIVCINNDGGNSCAIELSNYV